MHALSILLSGAGENVALVKYCTEPRICTFSSPFTVWTAACTGHDIFSACMRNIQVSDLLLWCSSDQVSSQSRGKKRHLDAHCTWVCKTAISTPESACHPKKRWIFVKTADYLPAISLLKINIPPAVCTNLRLCVRTCMPACMSWSQCVHYLCMRLL